MPAVAEDTLSYCTKCKMDLMHVICAMKGDQVQKVKCHTCGTTHQFKVPKGITEPGGAATATGAKKKKSSAKANAEAKAALSVTEEWKSLMSQHANAPNKKYNPKALFILGDRLQHGTFGDGIVQKIIYPNKIEVLFETDLKILIHSGTQAT